MRRTVPYLLIAIALFPLAINGQTKSPLLEYRVLAAPGIVISGHTFTPKTTIDSVALNDIGDVAFVARWLDDSKNEHAAIFTSQRLVLSEGDVVEGKYIALIAKDAGIAINAEGQVAYEAWYAASKEEAVGGKLGIFIDNHLALTPNNFSHTNFLLTDDGWVIPRHPLPRFGLHLPPPMFPGPTNARGQVVLSLNLKPSGFLLLLGTPLTH